MKFVITGNLDQFNGCTNGSRRGAFCPCICVDTGESGYIATFHGRAVPWKFSAKLAECIEKKIKRDKVWVISCYSNLCMNPPVGGFIYKTSKPVKFRVIKGVLETWVEEDPVTLLGPPRR